MRHPVYLLFFIFIIISCKKDNINTNSTLNNWIYYRDIIPDTTIHSVYPLNNGSPYLNPNDTTVYFYLDIDSNLSFDYQFRAEHQFVSYTSSGTHYNFHIGVSSLTATDSIAVQSNKIYNALILSEGEEINNTLKFRSAALLKFSVIGAPESFFFYGEKFMAIKRIINNVTMFGWIKINTGNNNSLTIHEYAFNETNNCPIICGQKN